jgi:hypothetical protein
MEKERFVIINDIKYKTGDKIKCQINDKIVNDAKIFLPTLEECVSLNEYNNVIFICQNEWDGRDCSNKLGYQYSWVADILYAQRMNIEKKEPKCFENILSLAFPMRSI